MASSINYILGIGIILIAVALLVLLFSPTEQRKIKKKHKEQRAEEEPQKDWQKIVDGMGKHIKTLEHTLDDMEKKSAAKDKQFAFEVAKVQKLQEKIQHERGWHDKEQSEIEKRTGELKEVKNELAKVQENYDQEHAQVLNLKSQLDQQKRNSEEAVDRRRAAESENAQLKTLVNELRQEILELKKGNAELKRKMGDESWVTRSEYIKLEQLVHQKDKEIDRLQRNIEKMKNEL